MSQEHLDVESIMRDSGIAVSILKEPEAQISTRQARGIIQRYCGLTHQSFPGLRYGMQLDLNTHGLLGYLMTQQSSHKEILLAIVSYFRVRLPLGIWSIHLENEYFAVSIEIHPYFNDMEAFLTQTVMGSLYRQGSMICKNLTLHFTESALPDVRGAHALLPVPLYSKEPRNEIRFHDAELTQPALPKPVPDPDHNDSLINTAMLLNLRTYLLAHCNQSVTLEMAAQHLGVGVRTLRRRLTHYQMSFGQIKLDIRMQLALRYLRSSGIHLERIAQLVGYSDQSCFSRAFKEWSGITPLAARQGKHPLQHRSS